MKSSKAKAILAKADSRLIQIGDDLFLAVGADSVRKLDAKAKAAMKRGATVVWPTGLKQWQTIEPIIKGDDTREANPLTGSARFVWTADGDSVVCQTFDNFLTKAGKHSKVLTGSTTRKFENV